MRMRHWPAKINLSSLYDVLYDTQNFSTESEKNPSQCQTHRV